MTQAKAATLAAAIINAGFACRVFKREDGQWIIHSQSDAMNVDASVVANFGTAQAVTAKVQEAEYI